MHLGVFYELDEVLLFLGALTTEAGYHPVQEEKRGVVQSHDVDAVVRPLDPPHLLQLAHLRPRNKLTHRLHLHFIACELFHHLAEMPHIL